MLGLRQIMPVPAGKADGWYEIGLEQIGRAVGHDLANGTGQLGRLSLVMVGQPNRIDAERADQRRDHQPTAPARASECRVEIQSYLPGGGHGLRTGLCGP